MANYVKEYKLKYTATKKESQTIHNATQAFEIIKEIYDKETSPIFESFYAVYMNNSNKVKGYMKISDGGIACTVVDPKIVLIGALESLSTAIILTHNHPSGNVKPSNEDKELTKKLKSAAKLLDILVVDHIIINDDLTNYYSFADNLEI